MRWGVKWATVAGLGLLLVASPASRAAGGNEMTPPTDPATTCVSALTEPIAPIDPVTHPISKIVDPYAYLKDLKDPRTQTLIAEENAHADAWLAARQPLQDALYARMQAFLPEASQSAPVRRGEYEYFSRQLRGQDYPSYYRRRVGAPTAAEAELVLDLAALKGEAPLITLGDFEVSPDGLYLAFTIDRTGARDYELYVRMLDGSGKLLGPIGVRVASVAWGRDSNQLVYTMASSATDRRTDQVWRTSVRGPRAPTLIYREDHDGLNVDVSASESGEWLWITSGGHGLSWVRALSAHDVSTALLPLIPLQPGIEYTVSHRGDRFYFLTNDEGPNKRVASIPIARARAFKPRASAHEWERVLTNEVTLDPALPIEDMIMLPDHLVLSVREQGLPRVRIIDWHNRANDHTVSLGESGGLVVAPREANAEFVVGKALRVTFESGAVPLTSYDYDPRTRAIVRVHQIQLSNEFDPTRYEERRVWAKATDGTAIPITLLGTRKVLSSSQPRPLVLYGYGAYGITSDQSFSTAYLPLLEQGVVFAVAHVRGGGEFGRAWYEAGKLGNKQNTFSDFIAAARHLVASGITTPRQMAAMGGSAGGLLVGAVLNQAPELFGAALAQVPFVDVVNTMLDPNLPLTKEEYEEWGNPEEPQGFEWIRAYSPYDNLRRAPYPAMLVVSGIADSQVGYWEPLKWVSRLRTLRTDRAPPLLLSINTQAGHGGATGRSERFRERARWFAFLIETLGGR